MLYSTTFSSLESLGLVKSHSLGLVVLYYLNLRITLVISYS